MARLRSLVCNVCGESRPCAICPLCHEPVCRRCQDYQGGGRGHLDAEHRHELRHKRVTWEDDDALDE